MPRQSGAKGVVEIRGGHAPGFAGGAVPAHQRHIAQVRGALEAAVIAHQELAAPDLPIGAVAGAVEGHPDHPRPAGGSPPCTRRCGRGGAGRRSWAGAGAIIRKGKEEKKTVKLGRLEDEKKQAALDPKKDTTPDAKPVVKKALGLDLANLTDDLRKKHNIKDKVKGVLITGVDPNSPASEKRLAPGMVIAEVQQQPVTNATELQQRLEKLKKDGKKAAVLLVVTPDGDPSFVALSLQ